MLHRFKVVLLVLCFAALGAATAAASSVTFTQVPLVPNTVAFTVLPCIPAGTSMLPGRPRAIAR